MKHLHRNRKNSRRRQSHRGSILRKACAAIRYPSTTSSSIATIERLDARVLLSGSITGTVFNDANHDGVMDNGETGVPGITVYMDPNYNHKLDSGEQSAVTDANGKYTFSSPPADPEILRVVLPSGATQTFPANGVGNYVGQNTGPSLTNENFGISISNAPGAIDAAYGSGGAIVPSFPSPQLSTTATAILVQSDGKSVFVSQSGPPDEEPPISGTNDFALARYTTAGTLDTTYGTHGIVITSFAQGNVTPTAAVMQPDGKVVVVGMDSNNKDILLARYTTSGALDSTFGNNGIVVDTPGFDYSTPDSLAIDGSGRIVVAGATYDSSLAAQVTVFRFLANGTLDSTFASAGIFRVTSGPLVNSSASGPFSSANSVAIESDGKIVIAGGTAAGDFFSARLTSAGALDTTFGTSGIADISFGENSSAASVAFVAGGKILLGGTATNSSSDGSFALARLNANGSLDTTFGTNGKTTTAFVGENGVVTAMTIQSNGKIILVGSENVVNEGDIAVVVARYSANGVLDTSFNGTGEVIYNHETSQTNFINETASSVALQADGKILVAGTQGEAGPGGSSSFATINRFFGDPGATGSISGTVFNDTNHDGIQDNGETGVAGVVVYQDPNYNHKLDAGEQSVTTDANGNYTFTNPPADPEILRIVLPNGATQSFPANGAGDFVGKNTGATLTGENFGIFTPAAATASMSGTVFNDINGNGVLDTGEAGLSARQVYIDTNNNGVFDTGDVAVSTNSAGNFTFANLKAGVYRVRETVPAGYQLTSPGGGSWTVTVTGSAVTGLNFGNQATTAGVLDLSYGHLSAIVPSFPGGPNTEDAVAELLQHDGKSIVVSSVGPYVEFPRPPGTYDFALSRYTAAGLPDTTYGTNGVVRTSFPEGNVTAVAAVMQPDGKVVVVGVDQATSSQIILARYTTSGVLDTTFGKNGVVVETPSTNADPNAIAVDGSGRIVVSGETSGASGLQVTLLRFLANGTVDSTFGNGGIDQITSPKLAIPSGSSANSTGSSVAIESDGKIVVAGGTAAGDFYAARVTSTGALDPTFGVGGVADISFGQKSGAISVEFAAGGKILLGGDTTNAAAVDSFALARLNANGSLDTTFGSNGKTITSFPSDSADATAMAIQQDGKIIVVGGAQIIGVNGYSMVIARYTAAGSLDTSFNSGGAELYNTNISDLNGVYGTANAVAIQTNGRILVAETQGMGGPGGSGSNININRFFGDATVAISGTVFKDTNGNGVLNTGEIGLGSRQVYLDMNDNGVFDSSDYYVITDSSGHYSFANLAPSTYFLREVLPAGSTLTAPTAGVLSITLTAGQSATAENFGNSK